MPERLQKIISASGMMSRRAAEACISEGRVKVNGRVAVIGETADIESDVITVDGERVVQNKEYIYVMLNKPKGYVTTLRDEKGRRCVTELLRGIDTRLYPVGRLDLNSEGLLIMTNDGAFANKLMHPSFEIEKCYRVKLKADNFEQAYEKLKLPVSIDGVSVSPHALNVVSKTGEVSTIDVTIHEGRNRQVRKMCAEAGFYVLNLKRIREGNLELGDLRSGSWRYLSDGELKQLKSLL